MSFSMSHPDFLVLLALGVLGALSLWSAITKRAPVTFLVRMLALGALLLAGSGARLELSVEHREALALIDISDSIEPAVGDRVVENIADRFGGDQLAALPFSRQPSTVPVKLSKTSYSQLKRGWAKLDVGATNLEKALGDGTAGFTGNVLLFSDGWETDGSGERAVRALTARGLHIFPVVPDDNGASDRAVRIALLEAPLVAASGVSVPVRVSLRNPGPDEQRGTLEIVHDGKKLLSREVGIGAGRESLFVADSDPAQEGIKEITAIFTPYDKSLPKSARSILLSTEKRERVYLLSGNGDDEAALRELLTAQGYQLKTLRGDQGRVNIEDFDVVSSIILNNISINQLAGDLPKRIAEYVERGGKLTMIGGNRSFGLGGYIASPIERILPVVLVPPMTEAKRLNVAVQLVLDKSQSMAADMKLDFAKEAGREVIRNMKEDDLVGVIGFDDAPFIALPLSPVGVNRALAMERIGRIYPKGRTYLFPAVDEARRALMRVNAGRKHVIVLTDGKLPDGGPFYLEFVRQLRVLGITVSTVLLGEDVDTSLLKSMADIGGGSFYQTADARNLPKIFLSDLKVASGERTMKERAEYLVKNGPSGDSLTQIGSFPPLLGYVQTRPKESAELDLVVTNESKAEPLLAHGRAGKGEVTAFTSDANGRWSSYWTRWGKFAQFWTDVLGSQNTKQGSDSPRFDLRYAVDRGKLQLDLSVFTENVQGRAAAQLRGVDGKIHSVGFEQVAPGRYKAEFAFPAAGRWDARIRIGTRDLTPIAFVLSGELFGEQRGKGFNTPFLEWVARETGGVVNPTPEQLLQTVARSTETTELGSICALAALLLLLLEILLREGFFRRRPRDKSSPVKNSSALGKLSPA